MRKSKWIVCKKWMTNKQMVREYNESSDQFNDYHEVEISVVRKSNKFGLKSYGWNGDSKIILFSSEDDGCNSKEVEWWVKVAEVLCEALNNNLL